MSGSRCRRGPTAGEGGAVLVAVLVVAALVMAAALAARFLADARLRAERRTLARQQALLLAGSAARGVAGWFEEQERGALRGAPPPGLGRRDRRRVDPDGDGRGVPFHEAPSPWNVRWKDPPAVVFRPPDGPAPGDRLAGTPDGPDWELASVDGPASAEWLDGWARLLDPGGRGRLVRVALCGPRPGAPGGTLGRVLVTVEADLPGGAIPVRARVAADLVAVPVEDLRRPLVVRGDARLAGDVAWERGEAVVGGDFSAPVGIEDGWPGGIPWAGPDRPVRRDMDGDGTDDDLDGDGTGDWIAWRELPGPVPDPWWRARVGGGWTGRFAAPGSCRAPWPFGPRSDPPAPPTREDRSGFLLGCPVRPFPAPVPAAWWRLAAAGVRGTARLVEDPERPGWFRLDGAGRSRPLAELLAATGGLRRIEPAPGRSRPLVLVLDGVAGGILVRGIPVVRAVAGRRTVPGGGRAPADPADTGGTDRPGVVGDPRLALSDPDGSCTGFLPGEWTVGAALVEPRACPPLGAALDGVLAVEGTLRLAGPLAITGQVRAETLDADGRVGPVRWVGIPAAGATPARRPGIPGAPRVLVTGLRALP